MFSARVASFARMAVGLLAASALPLYGAELPFPDLEVELVELGDEPLRVGKHCDELPLHRIKPSMPVSELRALLGAPNSVGSHEGTRYWDYNIHFPLAGETSELVCQFKVVLGEDDAVVSAHWRRQRCEKLYQALFGKPEPEKVNLQVLSLAGDVVFAFDSAELTAAGRAQIEAIVDKIKAEYKDPVITLVGHTDWIGSERYNLQLSRRRAEAVRLYMAELGLPSGSMVAEGRGESEPVVVCRMRELEALKRCLEPNRRVDIEVFERTRDADG